MSTNTRTRTHPQVIFMVDAIDEYVMQHLTDYDDFKFMNVQKEGVQFDESDEWKEMHKEKEKDWKDFTNWYLTLLGDKVCVLLVVVVFSPSFLVFVLVIFLSACGQQPLLSIPDAHAPASLPPPSHTMSSIPYSPPHSPAY